MWSKRMAAFLRGKGLILWDATMDTAYVHLMNFLPPGSRDMFDANKKVVDYLFRALCQSEFNRVHTENLAFRIWTQLKEAHVGNAHVQTRMFVTYQREYENFTHLPGESIDALFQRFTVVVNNMGANVDVLLYDDHDRAVKLLHSLDHTVWGGKFEAIVESKKNDSLTMNELFSKLKSAEVDRGMTAKIEGPTDSHSLALINVSKVKSNANPLLMVNSCITVRLDLQADKSPVVVKGPLFPRVVNPRYRIRGTMCNARIQSGKARKAIK
jgi:hypothetical protein